MHDRHDSTNAMETITAKLVPGERIGEVNMYHHMNHGLALMCPHCFKYIMIDVPQYDKVPIRQYQIPYPEKVLKMDTVQFYMKPMSLCPECLKEEEEHILVDIDPMIIGAIVSLNKMGLRTEYSCQGHVEVEHDEEDDTFTFKAASDGYVVFQRDIKIDKNDLPEGWTLNNMLVDKQMNPVYDRLCWDCSAAADDDLIEILEKEIGMTFFVPYNREEFEKIHKRIDDWIFDKCLKLTVWVSKKKLEKNRV